jgi:hypothetical protein
MSKKDIKVYNIEDIKKNSEIFVHQNAFIKPDGTIFIAKGYTGCNPAHQLESSALSIGIYDIGMDFANKFKALYEKLKSEGENPVYLYYLRSILVQYYGYTLFCRKEIIKSFDDRNKYIDCSIVPNPNLYGKDATIEQIDVMEELYNVNDDGTVNPIMTPCDWDEENGFIPSREIETNHEYMAYLLSKKSKKDIWHI